MFMDLPEEPITISTKQLARITRDVQHQIRKGREKYERYVLRLKKQGYSENEIEAMID